MVAGAQPVEGIDHGDRSGGSRGQDLRGGPRPCDEFGTIPQSKPPSSRTTAQEDIMSENTVTASVTRVINASRDKVWRAETEPQYFEQWFGAKPGSVKADLRSGGAWSATVTPGGSEIELAGSYVEVAENEKLVMTIPNGPEYVEVTITFIDLGDRTEVTSSTPVPPEAREIAEEAAGSILNAVAAIAESL